MVHLIWRATSGSGSLTGMTLDITLRAPIKIRKARQTARIAFIAGARGEAIPASVPAACGPPNGARALRRRREAATSGFVVLSASESLFEILTRSGGVAVACRRWIYALTDAR